MPDTTTSQLFSDAKIDQDHNIDQYLNRKTSFYDDRQQRVPVKSFTVFMYKNKLFYTIAAKKNIKFLT